MTTVAVAGALANKPHNGGEAWVRLSWVLGLRRLGIDVWFIEQITPADSPVAGGASGALEGQAWFDHVTGWFGLSDRSILLGADGRTVGVGEDVARDALAETDLLINVSGNLSNASLLRLPRRRAYLDLDPGYTQYWHVTGAMDGTLEQHEHLLTVGLRIGRRPCVLPTANLHWHPVPPPVVLAEWPVVEPRPAAPMTTVASWRGGYGRLEYEGHLFGQKAHEFRRLAQLPRCSPVALEAALDIHPADAADRKLLSDGGWRLVDPRAAAGDPDAFRRYIQRSAGELSPAQGVYVETRCGWFSDRTTRYLASGLPAIVQDTELPPEIPLGEGLLTFKGADDALAALRAVMSDYHRHRRAARALAEDHFDSDVVLTSLLEDLLS